MRYANRRILYFTSCRNRNLYVAKGRREMVKGRKSGLAGNASPTRYRALGPELIPQVT